MNALKKVLKCVFFSYLIYVFISFFVLFKFHPKNEEINDTNPLDEKVEQINNQVQVALIESPEEAISARLDLIKQAESTIDLAYYRWSDGDVSNLMAANLLEAADRGIEIRILLDGIVQLTNFNQPVEDIFLAFSLHPNIDMRLFEPFNPLLPIAWNHRMHEKMMLADQKFALIGGRNIQDRFYLEDADKKGLVKDREVVLYQPESKNPSVLLEMTNYYDELWNYPHTKEKHKKMTQRKTKKGEKILSELRIHSNQIEKDFLKQYFPNLAIKDWAEELVPTNNVSFSANNLGRMNQNPRVLKTLLALGNEAEESVFIQSPYIIPSKQMLTELDNFPIDPEKTTLFTNSEAVSPNVIAISAYNNHRKDLVDSGARVVEYQGPGSSHAKSSIFDEKISVVATFNMDPRSAYINTESMVMIESEEFAEKLKEAIGKDFDSSLPLDENYNYLTEDPSKVAEISPFRKMFIRILSWITPLFENLL